MKQFSKLDQWLFRLALVGSSWAIPASAMAQTAPSLDSMFANFGSSAVLISKLVIVAAWLTGIGIVCLALLKFKEYGEGGGRVKLSTPIMLTFVGAGLFAMPGMIDTATQTLSLGGYSGVDLLNEGAGGSGGPAGFQAGLNGVLLFVKLVGHIAFFRGFLLLKQHGEGNPQVGLGRPITHILGGAAAINIGATAAILSNTFGLGSSMGGLGI